MNLGRFIAFSVRHNPTYRCISFSSLKGIQRTRPSRHFVLASVSAVRLLRLCWLPFFSLAIYRFWLSHEHILYFTVLMAH